jgi:hypothetical protein
MNKIKIFMICILVVVALVATFNLNFNNSKNQSGLSLANIEALAQNETITTEYYCWPEMIGGIAVTRLCSGCSIVPFTTGQGKMGTCSK